MLIKSTKMQCTDTSIPYVYYVNSACIPFITDLSSNVCSSDIMYDNANEKLKSMFAYTSKITLAKIAKEELKYNRKVNVLNDVQQAAVIKLQNAKPVFGRTLLNVLRVDLVHQLLGGNENYRMATDLKQPCCSVFNKYCHKQLYFTMEEIPTNDTTSMFVYKCVDKAERRKRRVSTYQNEVTRLSIIIDNELLQTGTIINTEYLNGIWTRFKEKCIDTEKYHLDSDCEYEKFDNGIVMKRECIYEGTHSNIEENDFEDDPKIEDVMNANTLCTIGYNFATCLSDAIKTAMHRQQTGEKEFKYFKFIQVKAVANPIQKIISKVNCEDYRQSQLWGIAYHRLISFKLVQEALRFANFLCFPDKKLLLFDSGKLQKLSFLLKDLSIKKSKVLIFTQMSKMLDILESFLNLHGFTYVRLDGSYKVEDRQMIVDRFNNDKRVFCFLASTRCGGIGINLTAADSVIFYDTDWNPAMDKQAQDRCHRIGQTRTVHIYRLITLNTIEENIFKKSLQKRELGGLVMEEGKFDTDNMKRVYELLDQLQRSSHGGKAGSKPKKEKGYTH